MTDLYLLETDLSEAWYPFQQCRPVCELRAGAWLIRERWEAIADGPVQTIFAPGHLHGFAEDGVPAVGPATPVEGPALVGSSTFAPSGVKPDLPRRSTVLVNDGRAVGWWVPAGARWTPDAPHDTREEVAVEGLRLHGSYDLITALEYFLVADTADFTHEAGERLPDGSIVIGDPGDVVVLGAIVEPGVVFDTRRGAVVVEQHVHVKSGTRLEGPIYIGPGSEVHGGAFTHSAFGPRCKLRGDITHSVFLGYANKVHEGFVGHSVIGRWVNMGAGTTTSNLKNTYGGIRVQIGPERHETGRLNLGTVFGDHVKTAIGTMLDTGTVVGVGANVFGWPRPPKYIAPFAWGADGIMRRDGFLDIAARVMPRRKVEYSDAVRDTLGRIYDDATG
jgi:UDP-N-acetylglucosamine diphosphorylase/glucosamine-1-phosphate N-acetyltransferase